MSRAVAIISFNSSSYNCKVDELDTLLKFHCDFLTLYGSPVRIRFWRNFSKLGGATKTVYGFKSDERNSFKLCGCKFRTQILPLETTARMASNDVPSN